MARYAIYSRLSEEKTVDLQKLALLRQDQVCDALVARHGGTVGKRYVDPDNSAFDKRKERPDFELLLVELPQWEGLAVKNIDRLCRDPWDLERMIKVYDANPHLSFYTEEPGPDLSTEEGREVARHEVIAARRESRRGSRRQADRHEQWRELGRPVGRCRPFGLEADRATVKRDEKRLLNAAAKDILGGVTIHAIVKRWTEQGITTTEGNAFTRTNLRNMLMSPRMAGYLVHRKAKYVSALTGQPVKGYPELIPESVWEAMCEVLRERGQAARGAASNRRAYLMTGTLMSGRCGGTMHGSRQSEGRSHRYICANQCCSVHGENVDKTVERVLLDHWSKGPIVDLPDPLPFENQVRLDVVERKISETMAAYRADKLSIDLMTETIAELQKEKADLESAKRQAIRAQEQARVMPTDWLSAWEAADLDGRRVLVAQELEMVVIDEPTTRGPKWDPFRVRLMWRK